MTHRLDTLSERETPEGVVLRLRVAGPWARGLALALDQVVRSVALSFLAGPLALVGDAGTGLLMLCAFLLEWLYPVAFELGFGGRTLGKAALGLVVVMEDGTPVSASASLLRNLLRFADLLPMGYLVGLISMTVDPSFRRLGDLAAGTVVVHQPARRAVPTLPEAAPVAVPVALRPEEQRAIVDFAARSAGWSAERRAELAAILEPLAGGPAGEAVRRLFGMARWLQGECGG